MRAQDEDGACCAECLIARGAERHAKRWPPGISPPALTLILAGLFPVPIQAQIRWRANPHRLPVRGGRLGRCAGATDRRALARRPGPARHRREPCGRPGPHRRAGREGDRHRMARRFCSPPLRPCRSTATSTSRSPTIQSSISSRSRRSRPSIRHRGRPAGAHTAGIAA